MFLTARAVVKKMIQKSSFNDITEQSQEPSRLSIEPIIISFTMEMALL